ncbi:hypothetical protein LC55x_3188 [Lysobacter capsici]|uniref:Uncharacterized protein n=1 Tax=Lysobacter capsici AZ78 TaxID=1444315 RepID=A0A125U074_9GAMM|nr:hypothetical protein LC55x_3188 [Lysobacter capsici]KWS02448.1 hypothetical protein AZ78_5115 [Lysobacter capsici AZ78]
MLRTGRDCAGFSACASRLGVVKSLKRNEFACAAAPCCPSQGR